MKKNNTAELIMTRISHDLIGNIGAVSNAVELLEEGDLEFMDDIKSILKVSSKVLSARLKFFRLAFGLENSTPNLADVQKICRDYLSSVGSKAAPTSFEINLPEIKNYKNILLGVMIVADMVIKGGRIRVEEENGALYVVSEESVLAPKEKIEDAVSMIKNEFETSNAQFAPIVYLKEILKGSSYNLYSLTDDRYFGVAIK